LIQYQQYFIITVCHGSYDVTFFHAYSGMTFVTSMPQSVLSIYD